MLYGGLVALALLPGCGAAFAGGSVRRPQLSPSSSRHAAATRLAGPTSAVQMQMDAARGVPLTGLSMHATLKIRCDTTDAAYAIFWTKVRDEFTVAGTYAPPGSAAQGYVAQSESVSLNGLGTGPVATTKRSGQGLFVPDVSQSNLQRRELGIQYGIGQIAFIPYEDGVIEFGNCKSSQPWLEIPQAPSMPKMALRKAFEELGALYAMLWRLEGDTLRVIGHFEAPREKARQKQMRGDGESFVGISRTVRRRPPPCASTPHAAA